MDSRNYHMPDLNRDLAWILGGMLAIAAGVGAVVAVAADVLIHRHRATVRIRGQR